jgi:serine/threonine-protein kinase RsbW
MIRLRVPGSLRYRDLVCRVVGSSCKLLGKSVQGAGQGDGDELESQVISAVGEAFNNIAIHAYGGWEAPGDVDIEIAATNEEITIRMSDTGQSFDPTRVPEPDLAGLPEAGMGLYIMRSFMDSVVYTAGRTPAASNVLVLSKRRAAGGLGQSATRDQPDDVDESTRGRR